MWILCITHPECGSTWLTCVADQNDFEHHIPCFLPRHSHPDACIRARESNAVRTRNSQRRIACTDAADRRGANEPTSRLYDRRGRAWPGLFAVFSTSTPRFWGDQSTGAVLTCGGFQLRPPTSPSVPAATRLPRPRGSAAHAADGRKAPAQEKQERTRGCRRRGGRRCGCWGRDAGSRRTGSACRRGVRVQAAVPRVPGFAEAGWRLLERRA